MMISSLLGLYGAGLLTFASPCVLPLLPLYLGVLAGASGGATPNYSRVRWAGLGFSLGLLLVFVAVGHLAARALSVLGAEGNLLQIAAGALIVLFGVHLLGLLRLPGANRDFRPLLSRVPSVGGFFGGLLFGAAFGLGWTPCVGPVLGAALGYAASATADPWVTSALLGAYGLGLATPLVAAAFSAPRVLGLARRLMSHTQQLSRVMGALMVVGGAVYLVSVIPDNQPAACESSATSCDAAPTTAEVDDIPARRFDGPALIQFSSHDCSVCERMRPLMDELERRCDSQLVRRVDIDAPGGRALAARFNVRHLPTFLTVDQQGTETSRTIGELSRRELTLTLEALDPELCRSL
jgi:cytochrome c-type biogenesis protein